MAVSRMADQIGRVLGGRYRLIAPIGAGASASVFLAEDVTLRRRVAVKLLHAALAGDESFLRRFQAEARAAAALSHPNVMAVYDWGEDEDGPFLVLELLSGGSLRSLLDRGTRLTPSQALLVGLQVARGLDYAHRRGLVHRDVKPANLLFDDEGRLRIADFGVARALAEAAWTEPTGSVIGSARYASPEQAQGRSLDGRSDVYSLALVLVETVTGSVPFTADTTIATLMARTTGDLVVPAALDALAPVVAAAGRVDPDLRPDASTFARSLEGAARDLPRPDPLPVGEALAHESGAFTLPIADPDPTLVGSLAEAPAVTGGGSRSTTSSPGAPAVAPPRRRRRWPWLVVFAALLALVGGGLAAADVFVPSHQVPYVVGRDRAAAVAALERLDFEVETTTTRRDGTRAGEVLSQTPRTGSLKEGRTVRLVVSAGNQLVVIPHDLVGKHRDQVIAALQALGFVVDGAETGQRSADVPKGHVISIDRAGDEVEKGTRIAFVTSEGPPPVVMQEHAGKAADLVKADLEARGLKVAFADGYSDEVQAGRVIGTTPGPGEPAEVGSTVRVTVSRGPETVKVPEVTGKRVEEARQQIEAAGLRVGGVYGPPGARRVIVQDPRAGAERKRGDAVNLYTGS